MRSVGMVWDFGCQKLLRFKLRFDADAVMLDEIVMKLVCIS